MAWRMISRLLDMNPSGPITELDPLGPALDQAVAIVESGKPVVVDVLTQPR